MPLDQNPHQKVTRFGCVSFSMYACEFSVPQMLRFCLFTYPPRSKWASSEKMIFFDKIGIFCKTITGPLPSVVQAYTQPYLFGGRIKLIIYQIRHELSVIIHYLNKSDRWRTLYNKQILYNHAKKNYFKPILSQIGMTLILIILFYFLNYILSE